MLARLHVVGTHKSGAVFDIQKALDTRTACTFAVKILRSPGPAVRRHHRLLKNEWKVGRRLAHGNILAYHHFGTHQGRPYLVMDWVEGENLKQFIASFLPDGFRGLAPRETFRMRSRAEKIVRQMIEVLLYIHRENIVHCDIKPENFLLLEDDTVKLIDFGYARTTGPFAFLKKTKSISGTPSFISPEQIKKERPTEISDIYSLGATIYHLLAGHPPHRARDTRELLAKHLRTRPVPLYGYVPGVRKKFSEYVEKMLVPDQERRLRNLAAVKMEIITNGIFNRLTQGACQ